MLPFDLIVTRLGDFFKHHIPFERLTAVYEWLNTLHTPT